MAQKTQSPEFSNSIFVKFLWHSFLYFKLLIYLPEIRRPKCFRGFTPLPWIHTNRAPPWTCYRAYIRHLQIPTCIFLNLCSKMDIKKKTLLLLFVDGVQLPQGYSHFDEAVYFLPFSFQKFLVLFLSTSEEWKTESTLEPPSGFEQGTPGLGIQWLIH